MFAVLSRGETSLPSWTIKEMSVQARFSGAAELRRVVKEDITADANLDAKPSEVEKDVVVVVVVEAGRLIWRIRWRFCRFSVTRIHLCYFLSPLGDVFITVGLL